MAVARSSHGPSYFHASSLSQVLCLFFYPLEGASSLASFIPRWTVRAIFQQVEALLL